MSRPILYSYFRSSCSYRVRIALHLKGVDNYQYRAVHLLRDGGEQRKGPYLALNPKGEVPFFIHGETRLAQSMAILHYIDKEWPGPPHLFPQTSERLGLCLQLCEIVNSGIQPLQNLGVNHFMAQQFALSEQQKKEWNRFWIEKGFQALEECLKNAKGVRKGGRYSLGDEITASDLFLVPQVYNANRFGVDMFSFPSITRIYGHCIEEEAFVAASPAHQPDAPNDDDDTSTTN